MACCTLAWQELQAKVVLLTGPFLAGNSWNDYNAVPRVLTFRAFPVLGYRGVDIDPFNAGRKTDF